MMTQTDEYILACLLYDRLEDILIRERQAIIKGDADGLEEHAITRNSIFRETEKLGSVSKYQDRILQEQLVKRIKNLAMICEENRQYLSRQRTTMAAELARLSLSRKAQKAYIACGCR